MGEIPLMTPQGTFVINGAERVVVSPAAPLARASASSRRMHLNGKVLYSFRIIPDRGSWLEVQFDTNDLLYVYLDRRKRRRKFLATTFLRALGYGSDEEILKLFYNIEKLKLSESARGRRDRHQGAHRRRARRRNHRGARFRAADQGDRPPDPRRSASKTCRSSTPSDDDTIIKALKKDPAHDEEEALKEIYRRLRPGDPPTVPNAARLLKRLFFDPKRYDLGRVGRYKINQKLGLKVDLERAHPDRGRLRRRDEVSHPPATRRRHRSTTSITSVQPPRPHRRRIARQPVPRRPRPHGASGQGAHDPVRREHRRHDAAEADQPEGAVARSSATSSAARQLSQFMDQINPLAELTHKRRLSALGPGGLSRDRAGFEVRDVHPSHYGRICPIETPEGPNIGLISSLSHLRPGQRVRLHRDALSQGRRTAASPTRSNTSPPTRRRTTSSRRPMRRSTTRATSPSEKVTVRYRGDFLEVEPAKVHYMDVSPKQLVSVAAGLIPFLEHDDANRALMGSNMQRQGVPLLVAEAPLVGTGMEGKVARDSKAVVVAEASRQSRSASPRDQIIVTKDGEMPEGKKKLKHDPRRGRLRLRAAQVHALERRHLHQPEADRQEGPEDQEGPGHRRRSVHRAAANSRSAATCSSRSCLERLQLRGRHPDLREGREGGHLHLDPHR